MVFVLVVVVVGFGFWSWGWFWFGVVVATFRVARLTVQTRKLWLVGVATDHEAPLACPNVKNLKNKEKRK